MFQLVKRLPAKLEELRLANGCTKKQIAQYLGISQAMYCKVIGGHRVLPNVHLEPIAQRLNADLNELRALSLADKVSDEASCYPNDVVKRALSIISKEQKDD